jgi:hypothetical protein
MTEPKMTTRRSLADLDPFGDPIGLEPGPYEGYWKDGQQPFAIEVDGKPLAVLFDDANKGTRVYEFMSISRPGDIYHYLRVRTMDVSERLSKEVQRLKPRWVRSRQHDEWGDGYLPLSRFDNLFHWDGDDTTPESHCWLQFRAQSYWETTAVKLLSWVKERQNNLRSSPDWLIQREIGSMDRGIHRRDFIADIERRCLATSLNQDSGSLPACVHLLIDELVTRHNVQSVSAPYKDFKLWRRLCMEQLRRADQTGYSPEEAFPLSGPDGGLWHVPFEDWGADVHIPYEGICMADLYIKPDWRRDSLERDSEGGQLVRIFSSFGYEVSSGQVCHYVLTPDDLGELKCAARTEVGEGWILYQSKQPYEPNPSNKPHLSKGDVM